MRSFCYLFIAMMAVACSSSGYSPEEQAAQAALSYYNRLLEGYPDGLLAATANADSLPGDYKNQLVKVYEQFMSDIHEKHGGLHAVSISENVARRDTVQGITYAFLLLSFKDSTQEEITVPMVERNGEWLLR